MLLLLFLSLTHLSPQRKGIMWSSTTRSALTLPYFMSGRMLLTDRFARGFGCSALPEMQRDAPNPAFPVPVLLPTPIVPPHLACRGCPGLPGLEDDQVRTSAGVWQLSLVSVQKCVQDT